jgi:hypothetical protein
MRSFTIIMSAASLVYGGLGISFIQAREFSTPIFHWWRFTAYPIALLWFVGMGARFAP